MSFRFGKSTSSESPVLASVVSCHAFNADGSLCAVSLKSNEIYIYETKGQEDFTKWERKYTLNEHTQVVTDLDWAPKTNRILSCSEDRNAYVWNFDGKEWKPTLVLLRINRAAICCRWSPDENKFAVGSGQKLVSVCYYEEENKWWVSKMIKKPHRSTVTAIAWHPKDNTILATASTDMKCRVFSAYIKGVDAKEDKKAAFGTLIGEWSARSWVQDVAFSPSGSRLAFVSHDSSLTVVEMETQQPTVLTLPNLPFLQVRFLDENSIVAAGYDFSPYIFSFDTKTNQWVCRGSAETKTQDTKKTGSVGVRSAFEKFQKQATMGSHQISSLTTRHKNVINKIKLVEVQSGKVTKFTTSGNDGRILYWKPAEIAKNLQGWTY